MPVEKIVQQIAEHATKKSVKIAVAESCTGGLLAAYMTGQQGASVYFQGGVIAYDNAVKKALLDVSETTLNRYGAVSEPVALEMVAGLAKGIEADVYLSITGIAGPGGGSLEKPVGTVFFGCSAKGSNPVAERKHFSGDRQQVRIAAVAFGLETLYDLIKERF